MKHYIKERIMEEANIIIQGKLTLRETASKIKASKSTVHLDMIQRLPIINPQLAEEVKAVLDLNVKERSIRGGEATRQKYIS